MQDLARFFQKSELIPAVVQHVETGAVLMLGYVNLEALQLTLDTMTAWFYSRSRDRLWNKGESSGNFLRVRKVYGDCDSDSLLFICAPDGPTCHTGAESCFYDELFEEVHHG